MTNYHWTDTLFVNSAFEDVTGCPVEAFREDPSTFFAGAHPDDRERVQGAMASVSDGETVDIQFRLTTDDGGEQWVQARGEPIFDSAGEVVRVAGFVVGITDRRERQRELERYKTTIEASGDPVYTLDADGTFTVVNEAFCAMTGYEEADLLGAHFATILTQTDRLRGADVVRSVSEPDTDHRTRPENCQTGHRSTRLGDRCHRGGRRRCTVRDYGRRVRLDI